MTEGKDDVWDVLDLVAVDGDRAKEIVNEVYKLAAEAYLNKSIFKVWELVNIAKNKKEALFAGFVAGIINEHMALLCKPRLFLRSAELTARILEKYPHV